MSGRVEQIIQQATLEREGAMNEIAELSERFSRLLQTCYDLRDLVRTGLIPDELNMTELEWLRHKMWRIESELSAVIRDVRG